MRLKLLLLTTLIFNTLLVFKVLEFTKRSSKTSAVIEASTSGVTEASYRILTNVQYQFSSLDWHNLEATNYRAYVKNLRDARCPRETLVDIINADISKLFKEKEKEVRGRVHPHTLWFGI
jgi:hypothetical protein